MDESITSRSKEPLNGLRGFKIAGASGTDGEGGSGMTTPRGWATGATEAAGASGNAGGGGGREAGRGIRSTGTCRPVAHTQRPFATRHLPFAPAASCPRTHTYGASPGRGARCRLRQGARGGDGAAIGVARPDTPLTRPRRRSRIRGYTPTLPHHRVCEAPEPDRRPRRGRQCRRGASRTTGRSVRRSLRGEGGLPRRVVIRGSNRTPQKPRIHHVSVRFRDRSVGRVHQCRNQK